MNDKRLIVNADDLGMSRGITDGILIAHRYGVLTSASLMVNMPASEYAIERLASAPRLGIGIHLNICQGAPVLPAHAVPSLVNATGDFHAPREMLRLLWRWQVDLEELESEFRAQIRWAKIRGVEISHADSHHHMHIYPAALLPFARALAAEGVFRARASRCVQWAEKAPPGGPHEGGMARRLIVQAYRASLQFTIFRTLESPDRRISFLSRSRRNPRELERAWRKTLDRFRRGTFELACHPGLPEPGFSETDTIARQREYEFRWLTDHEFRAAVERNGIQLITYRDLCERQPVRQSAAQAVVERRLS
jgi:chitin disaccharide deacetylase